MDLEELRSRLRQFADARNWAQFHNPKNLAMALTGEAGELLEVFQWLTPEQSMSIMDATERADHVRQELADILAYLVQLADVLDIDLLAALSSKIDLNELRYPIDRAHGNAAKYDELDR